MRVLKATVIPSSSDSQCTRSNPLGQAGRPTYTATVVLRRENARAPYRTDFTGTSSDPSPASALQYAFDSAVQQAVEGLRAGLSVSLKVVIE